MLSIQKWAVVYITAVPVEKKEITLYSTAVRVMGVQSLK